MAKNKTRFFILTGEPGIGKTTLTKKLSSSIVAEGVNTSGFYTEEVRSKGVREGFDVVTLEGKRGHLAIDQSLLTHPAKYKVGKYGVLLEEFENVALPSLDSANAKQSHLFVIDEIGKMELFSGPFKTKIKNIFSENSNCMVLATIPVRRCDQLVEWIRHHNQTKLWMDVAQVNLCASRGYRSLNPSDLIQITLSNTKTTVFAITVKFDCSQLVWYEKL